MGISFEKKVSKEGYEKVLCDSYSVISVSFHAYRRSNNEFIKCSLKMFNCPQNVTTNGNDRVRVSLLAQKVHTTFTIYHRDQRDQEKFGSSNSWFACMIDGDDDDLHFNLLYRGVHRELITAAQLSHRTRIEWACNFLPELPNHAVNWAFSFLSALWRG